MLLPVVKYPGIAVGKRKSPTEEKKIYGALIQLFPEIIET